jgi:hypothetical protein
MLIFYFILSNSSHWKFQNSIHLKKIKSFENKSSSWDGLYSGNVMNKYKEKSVCVNEMKDRKKCPKIKLYYILRSC